MILYFRNGGSIRNPISLWEKKEKVDKDDERCWLYCVLQGACFTVKEEWWALSIQWTRWRQCQGLIVKGPCVGPTSRLISTPESIVSLVLEVRPIGWNGTINELAYCIYIAQSYVTMSHFSSAQLLYSVSPFLPFNYSVEWLEDKLNAWVVKKKTVLELYNRVTSSINLILT